MRTSSLVSRRLAAAAGIALSAALAAGLAPAAGAAPVAPGAPMRVSPVVPTVEGVPAELDTYSCSQGASGVVTRPDGASQAVLLTAAHCTYDLERNVPLDSAVKVPKQGGDQVVGYRAESAVPDLTQNATSSVDGTVELFTSEDWATVHLNDNVATSRVSDSIDYHGNSRADGAVMTGVRDYADLAPGQFSVDNFGQPICKDGSASGRSCGVQLARSQDAVFSWGLTYENGDSGGNNFDPNNGEIIGVTSQGVGAFGRAQTADAALQDAYGIPDGQVNEHFALPESTEPHDGDFRSLAQDEGAAAVWVDENLAVDLAAVHRGNAAAAQADADHYAAQLQSEAAAGDLDAVAATAQEAVDAAGRHATVLPESAALAALQQGANALSS